ncbi:7938_t:CDS:1 [Funneliformis geosporum]|uniref:930_t:CDS:1 n=1 Tax=Funneliformis geosporum TaxID=1117311 RepID=A0A9W4WXE9_9GLOM|nr:7938_t:CDS:1 [Funneliformis geosporum]CAI2170715.1 930_t:CDS:1 [Funneliformis geosporum]
MDNLLNELNKFNVKTEEEIFVDQFSKLTANVNNKSTENQSNPLKPYATHQMFGKDILHTTTPLNQENVNIPSINTISMDNKIWQDQFKNKDYAEMIGWNQPPKVIDDEDWGNLPDVNTSVDPNNQFGMTCCLSSEILNLGNANVHQPRIFGSGFVSKAKSYDNNRTETQLNQGFATEDKFKIANE